MASSSFRTVVRTIVGVLLLVTVLLGVYDSYVCTTAVAVPSSSTVKNSIISANLSSVSSSLSSSFTTTTTENLPHVRNDPNNAGTCTATTATMTMTTAVHYHWHPVEFVSLFRDCMLDPECRVLYHHVGKTGGDHPRTHLFYVISTTTLLLFLLLFQSTSIVLQSGIGTTLSGPSRGLL